MNGVNNKTSMESADQPQGNIGKMQNEVIMHTDKHRQTDGHTNAGEK